MLALVLSFAVLVGFSYMFPQTIQQGDQNATTQQNVTTTSTPAPASPASQNAPVTTNTAAAVAPATSSTPTPPVSTGTVGIIATITAKDFIFKIDKLGRIKSAVLLKDKYRDDDGNNLELFDTTKTLPLEVRFFDTSINAEAFAVAYTSSASDINLDSELKTVILTQKLSSLTLTKKITFYNDGHYDLDVSTDKKADFYITPGHRPEADDSMYMLVRGALVRDTEGILTTVEDDDAEKAEVIANATIVSAFDRYDVSLFYNFEAPMTATITADPESNPLPFVQANQSLNTHGYIGPKDWRVFEAIHPDLTNAIEFGWFTFLSKPFFAVMLWMHAFVGNWGWAIILFTLMVKLILFPLSYKGMMSMQKLKELAPKMKELKERYGKDPAKMNQQMMALYKKHGANPMGGCLPMILQIPVFFALYRVLLNADEMQGAPWIGWIVDLSDKDPYFILPILMGVSMFLQQKIIPSNITDPMQQKIFQYFPVVMTFFFLKFPAGLVLYWLTNSLLSIAQQYYINHAFEKYKAQAKLGAKGTDTKD